MLNFNIPFGAVQLSFEDWDLVYLVRSSCTSGQRKRSDCVLCEGESVCSGLDADLGDWNGLGEDSSWMSGGIGLMDSLRLGLPVETERKEKPTAIKWAFPFCPCPRDCRNNCFSI